jgi:myo-inositol-1(or 4)-monophosphatase
VNKTIKKDFKQYIKIEWSGNLLYQEELELLEKNIPNIFLKTESQAKTVSYKQRNEVVTSSDLFIETEIINLIKKHYPNDKFHSEEFNRDTELMDRTWLIDPIDGTSNYVHKLDLFVVQIALFNKNEVVLSYVYVPRFNKTYKAIKNNGAFLNDKRIHVASDTQYSNKLMSLVGLSHQTTRDKYIFKKMIDFSIENGVKIRVIGSIGFEMSALAEGIFTMLYTDVTNLWDIAPGLLLVKEAGGIIVNHQGKPYKLGDQHMFVFSNNEIMEKVIQTI